MMMRIYTCLLQRRRETFEENDLPGDAERDDVDLFTMLGVACLSPSAVFASRQEGLATAHEAPPLRAT